MCGLDVVCCLNRPLIDIDVLLRITHHSPSGLSDNQNRRSLVSQRGPDFSDSVLFDSDDFQLDMFGSVLHIQGSTLCPQPLVAPGTGSALLWNGEFLNHAPSDDSDTALVLNMLESTDDVVSVLGGIQGPFAFVYFDRVKGELWFGKDELGRRSLLFGTNPEKDMIVITSVGLADGLEIPACAGAFCLSLTTSKITHHPWRRPGVFGGPSFLSMDGNGSADIYSLYATMKKGIHNHISCTSVAAPLGILFSGGIDSAIMASIAAEVFTTCEHKLTHIDLINIASANTSSPDRATGLVAYSELLSQYPSHIFRFICVDIEQSEIREFEHRIMELAYPNNSHMDFNISSALWFGGRAHGRVLDPSFIQDPSWLELSAQIIQTQSVSSANENRRPKVYVDTTAPVVCSKCGRRKTKPGCILHACRICCLQNEQIPDSSKCPAHTPYIDPSVGEVQISISDFLGPYVSDTRITSDSRVLLVGHGADELFGGYGRHETRSKQGGFEGLRSEMMLDLERLWTRNLGRDDRVLADHARDTRHPFLDDGVISWVGKLTPKSMSHSGEGNKPILRRLGREILKLEGPPNFRKRAIQFGTRLAQQTNVAVYGSHSKGSGTETYKVGENRIS